MPEGAVSTMSKLREVKAADGTHHGWMFRCPGCAADPDVVGIHCVTNWTWNGSHEKPTFSPSVLVTMRCAGAPDRVCHSFVTDGRIQYLADCTHALAGQTVDLPDWGAVE